MVLVVVNGEGLQARRDRGSEFIGQVKAGWASIVCGVYCLLNCHEHELTNKHIEYMENLKYKYRIYSMPGGRLNENNTSCKILVYFFTLIFYIK